MLEIFKKMNDAGPLVQSHRDSDPKTLLQRAGFHVTRGRCAILRILLRTNDALSVAEIAARIKNRQLSKVTVHRALHDFEKKGLLHQAFVNNRTAYYELADRCEKHRCHPHFVCHACGSGYCLVETRLPLTENLPKGFILYRQQVRIEGLCPACSGNSS